MAKPEAPGHGSASTAAHNTTRGPVPEPLPYQLAGAMQIVADRPFVVKHLLDAAVCAVLFGESGAGKSHVAIDMSIAIAQGRPFFGHKTQRGSVLYLAGEGADGLVNRIVVARPAGQLTGSMPLALVREPVVLDPSASMDPQRVIETVKDLATQTGETCQLIVIDTLARSISGDENSSEDMGRFVRACDEIRQATKAAVLIVHHAGKDSTKGARGHSSLRAAVDTELLVEGRENPRTLSVTKQRDLPIAQAFQFELKAIELARDTEDEPVTCCVVRELGAAPPKAPSLGKQQAALLGELEKRQADSPRSLIWNQQELREAARSLGMHKNTARAAVIGLMGKQLLLPSGGGHRLVDQTEGLKGRKRTNGPISSRTVGDVMDEGSIRPRPYVPSHVPGFPCEENLPW